MGELSGKAAMVVGAAGYSSLGEAIAVRLAAEGADVAVHGPAVPWPESTSGGASLRTAGDIARAVRAMGRKAAEVLGDPADSAEVARMFRQAASELGRLDILVNCASTIPGGALLDTQEATWREGLHANLRAPFLCSREAAKYVIQGAHGGKIVHLSSHAARIGIAGLGIYSATQFGLVGLTLCQAMEWAEHAITVNILCVGKMRDPVAFSSANGRNSGAHLLQEWNAGRGTARGRPSREWPAALPLSGGASVDDVTGMVAFLASRRADHVTGQIVDLSGGQVM